METFSADYTTSALAPKDFANAVSEYSKNLNGRNLSQIAAQLNEGEGTDLYTSLILMQMLAKENPELYSALGDRYYSGNCVRQNEQKALRIFQEAADRGSIRAMYDLAWYYYDRKEYMRASDYFKSCIDAQDSLESYMIAKSYACLGNCRISISEPKYPEGIEYLSIAADKYHDAFACRRLGLLYAETGTDHFNGAKSVRYFEQAAEYGDLIAVRELSTYYLLGNTTLGISKNGYKAEAMLLPHKDKEDISILANLGLLYLWGDEANGFDPDFNKACLYYEKAARMSDDVKIIANLGYAYFRLGRYKESEEMLLAADSRNYCICSDFLARIYKYGYTGVPDMSRALQYYERAYSTNCINNVFTCNEYVELLIQCGLFQKAYEVAEYGYKTYNDIVFIFIKADLILSQKIRNEVSLEQAAEMMELCIQYNSHVEKAHMALARYYLATRDYRKAEKSYMDAFNAGVADAGASLAYLYEKGGGTIAPNPNKAYEWFAKAAERGSMIGAQELQCWKKGLIGGYRRIRSLG